MLMEGASPAAKKWWTDRSKVGLPCDPARGTKAIARAEEYMAANLEVLWAEWEEDFASVKLVT